MENEMLIRKLLVSKNCVKRVGEVCLENSVKFQESTVAIVQSFEENCIPFSERNILFYFQGSPGGSVLVGLEDIDFVEQIKKMDITVYTLVAGSINSMEPVIASKLAPKGNRYILPHAEVMIHQVLGQLSGQFADIKKQYKHMSDTNKIIMDMLAETTNMSIEEIEAACDRDTTYNAEEAVRLGFADYILI